MYVECQDQDLKSEDDRCVVSPVQVERAKVLSNTVKQKRKEKAGKWEVPLPKVRLYNLHSVLVTRPCQTT